MSVRFLSTMRQRIVSLANRRKQTRLSSAVPGKNQRELPLRPVQSFLGVVEELRSCASTLISLSKAHPGWPEIPLPTPIPLRWPSDQEQVDKLLESAPQHFWVSLSRGEGQI